MDDNQSCETYLFQEFAHFPSYVLLNFSVSLLEIKIQHYILKVYLCGDRNLLHSLCRIFLLRCKRISNTSMEQDACSFLLVFKMGSLILCVGF